MKNNTLILTILLSVLSIPGLIFAQYEDAPSADENLFAHLHLTNPNSNCATVYEVVEFENEDLELTVNPFTFVVSGEVSGQNLVIYFDQKLLILDSEDDAVSFDDYKQTAVQSSPEDYFTKDNLSQEVDTAKAEQKQRAQNRVSAMSKGIANVLNNNNELNNKTKWALRCANELLSSL